MMKKLYFMIAILTCVCLCANPLSANAAAKDLLVVSWQDKVDSVVLEKMNEDSEELIPVWLWMEDIDHKEVERQVYINTGLTESNLTVINQTVSDDLAVNEASFLEMEKSTLLI